MATGTKPIRWSSRTRCWGLPLVDIAVGGDPATGEWRGHARGIVAIGDVATGVVAAGGAAVGYYATGGAAWGRYVVSAPRRSPEAVAFFATSLPWLP